MSTILICGHRAYAARNLKQTLEAQGHRVLCFSRGEEKREGDVITGSVFEVFRNPFFTEQIDVVINFILLQNCSVEDNEKYIRSLISFCKEKKVKRLVQISSISSYPNDAAEITESTPVEDDIMAKGPYGGIKAIADKVLSEEQCNGDFEVVFVRPGYIIASDNPHPFKGVALFLTGSFAVLIGDKKATLPCVRREVLHNCLAEIAQTDAPLPVYLLIEQGINTKYAYFKSQSKAFVVPIPRWMVFVATNAAKALHIISKQKALTIKGVFKRQKFDNSLTQNNLLSI